MNNLEFGTAYWMIHIMLNSMAVLGASMMWMDSCKLLALGTRERYAH